MCNDVHGGVSVRVTYTAVVRLGRVNVSQTVNAQYCNSTATDAGLTLRPGQTGQTRRRQCGYISRPKECACVHRRWSAVAPFRVPSSAWSSRRPCGGVIVRFAFVSVSRLSVHFRTQSGSIMNTTGHRAGGVWFNGARPISTLTKLKARDKKNCMLCGHCDSSERMYGFLYQLDDIIVHHFCILLSRKSVQNGNKDEGLMGFFYDDIKKELRRGEKKFCFYCKKKGATISCSKPTCYKIFHLPCGIKNGSMHQYYDEFKSFCKEHWVIPKIPATELENRAKVECSICTNLVKPSNSISTFWAPCCKQSWFHRICIQTLCLNAGYVLKCPLCNNINTFKSRVLELGIYIPDRVPSWYDDDEDFE